MKTILALLVFLVFCHWTSGTCRSCKDTYDAIEEKTCDHVMTYIQCVYDADGDCTAEMTTADEVRLQHREECVLTDTCTCQVAMKKSDVSTDGKKCSERKDELKCLLATEGVGCDKEKTKIEIITASETATKAVTDCKLADTCQCQVNLAKAVIDTDAKKCTEWKKEIACLTKSSDAGLDWKSSTEVAKSVADKINQLVLCKLTETCKCENSYAIADVTAENNCTAAKAFQTCLNDVKDPEPGCDGTTLKAKVLTDVADVAVMDACPVSATCKCENTYLMADISTTQNKCTAAKAFQTCLNGVKDSEPGCDGKTLKAHLLTYVAGVDVKEACSGAGMLSQMTVFTCVMLLFSSLFKQ